MDKNRKKLKEEENQTAKARYISGDVRVSPDANVTAPQQKTAAATGTGRQQTSNSGWMRGADGPVFVTSGRQIKTSALPSKAAYPGVYDITPSEYAGAMQSIDQYNQKKEQGAPKSADISAVESEGGKRFLNKWFPENVEAGTLPSEDEIRRKYIQLSTEQPGTAQQDAFWTEWMANEAELSPLMAWDVEAVNYGKELSEAQAARDAAVKLLGEDAEKWATGNMTDYYERFGNEYRAEDNTQNDEAYLRYGDMDGIDLETAKRYSASPYIGRGRGYDLQRWAMTTQQQRDQYELLRSVYGQEEADNYLKSLQGELNRKLAGEEMELAQRYANEHPILSNAESILTAPIRGAVAMDAMAEGLLSGNGTDNYDPRMNLTRRADTIRGQTAQNLGGKKLAFLYQTLMSIGDNLANTAFWGGLNALPGGLGKLGLGSKAIQASMSGSAAASTFNDVVDRGGDNDQAMLAGTLSGIAEAVFEKYSIEGFLDLVTKEKGGKAVFDVLKQMGTEASEEGATEIANEIADRLVMGEKSNYETAVADMMAQGMTEGKARWEANAEAAKEVGLSALGGAVSGGVMGGTGEVLNWAGRQISGENTRNRQEAQQNAQEQTAQPEPESAHAEREIPGQRQQQEETEPVRVEREVTGRGPMQEEQAVQQNAQPETEPVLVEREVTDRRQQQPEPEPVRTEREITGRRQQPEPEHERVEREVTGKRTAQTNEISQQTAQSTRPDSLEGQDEKAVKSPSKAEKGKTLRVERKVTVRRNGNTQSMDITGVEDVSNGNVFLRAKAENGETEIVSAGDVEFADPVQQELMEHKGISRMDGIGVRNYLDGYDEKLATPAQYAEAFESAYEDGRAGITYEKMLEMDVAARRYLTGAARQAAYAAGERVNLKNAKGTKYQKIVTESLNRAIGGKIRFADEQIEGNGYYDPKTGEIVISRNADRGAYAYIAVHELGHKLKAENAEAWTNFRTLVEDALLMNDVDIDERISHTKELYSQRGQELTTEEALEEVICNSAASILQDEKIVRDMVNKDRSLMERVADFLREFVDRLSKAITDAGESMSELGSWKQLRALRDDHENLQKIYQSLMSALEETEENHFRDDAGMVKNGNKTEKFSMKEPVEETRDLLAVHNLTEENLRDSIELGGFAMPSIAVIKAEQGHSKYGPISVIFDKRSIDPAVTKENEIYGGDAYTPTFPKVEYEADEEAENKIRKKYYELEPKVVNEAARIMYRYATDLEGELNRNGGVNKIVNYLEDNIDMMQMYLADNGWEKQDPIKKTIIKRTPKNQAEQYEKLIQKMGKDVIQGFKTPEGESVGEHRKEWIKQHGEALKQAYVEVLMDETGISKEKAEALADNKKNLNRMLLDAYQYLRTGGETREEEIDYETMNKEIRKKVNRNEYKKWLNNLFEGAEKRKGIRNGRETFTSSGNRRNFAQTHWDVTLDNVVRAMRAEEKTGIGNLGSRSIVGAAVKKYNSIENVKADGERLRTIDENEYDAMQKEFQERFNEISKRYAGNGDLFDAKNTLVEYITKAQSAEKIFRLMQKDDAFNKPSMSVAKELADLVTEMKNAPTGYFEAKPRRTVRIDEVATIVVPDNMPQDLREQLESLGAELVEYKAGDEESRKEKINSGELEHLKFSVRETNEAVQEELKQTADAFEKVRYTHRITAAEADTLAGRILKEANSVYDRTQLAEEIAQIYSYVENAETVNMDHVDDMQTALMARVMDKSKVLNEEHEQTVEPIREYLKGTRIRLTESQRKEAASISGSYGAYRRDMMGRVKLVSTGGTELDVAWQELNEINPEWFPADATEGDMPGMLLEVKDAMKPVYMTGMNTEENASWLAGKLNMEYLGLPAVKASARNQSGFTGSVRELRKTMARFEETSAEEFGEALRLLEESRKKSKDQTEREALAELRRQYDEWKAKDANEREERFQMELKRAQDKIRANDLAMRRVYVQVLQKGYERQRSIDSEQRRERELVNKQRARTEATTRTLFNWLDKPTDAKHVPAGLEAPLNDVLMALDFGGKNTKVATQLSERLDKLATAIEGAQQQEDESRTTFLERDQQMVDELRRMAQLIKGNTEGRGVYDLKGAELKKLNKWLGVVKHVLVNAGKMRGSNLNEDVKQVAAESIMEISRKKPMKDKKWITKEWEKHYGVDMMDSFTFFERLGRTSTEVFNGLRKGFDQMAGHVKQSEDYTKKLLDGAELKNITGKKAEKLTFEMEKTGRKIEMTRAQIMELYVLNKREQARGHIYGDGIRIRGDEDAHAHAVTRRDVERITSVLTDEEKRIADGLQKFLSKECAKWGNEASLKLLGYEKFGEENYWPISTDPNTRNTTRLEDNFAANINAIKNQGMTKQLIEGASNTIMIGDVFDTYTRHISNMAAYASYAVPLSDFDRWYNSRGVKVEIANVMGDKGNQYIKNLLMSINGTAQKAETSDVGKIAGAFSRNAKTAAVAANVRVAIQQPTSYARAAMYISPKYLTAALGKKLENAELVDKYCGIAAWKRYGFYETNIGPNLREMIVGDRTTAEKIRELSMQPAAMGDSWTLNQLWKACELETDEMMPELAKGTEEYYQHVGQRMSEIVDRTQVVDSPFHRSQMMRSKNAFDQMLTNFMSEPTKTFNMLMSAIYDYAENRNSPAAKKRMARAFATWGATAVLTAAAAAVVDAFRDGDDEKDWLERYKDALLGNTLDGLNPLGMLPGVKDVLELLQGYEPSRLDQQSIQRIVWAAQEVGKYMNGESRQNLYGVTYKVAQAVSSTLGIPVSNVLRDVNAIVRSTMGVEPTKNTEAQKGSYVGKLINAMQKGDEKTAAQLRGKLHKEAGMSPKDIDTVIADRLSYDERIAQAWTAKKEGRVGDVNRTKNALAHEGFTGEMVDRAIMDYGNREEPKEKKEKDMDAQLTAKLYSYEDAMNAVNKGAGIDDIKAMMSEMVADSTAKFPGQAVKSEMQSRIKKEYMAAYEKGDTAKMDSLTMVLKGAIGTTEETITKWKAEKRTDDLKNAVGQYDGQKAKTAVAELRKSGKTDAQIKSSLSQYKEMYISAIRSGDRQTAQRIKEMLMGLGLKGKDGKPLYTDNTFAYWVK